MKPNVLSKIFTMSKDSSSKYKTGSLFWGEKPVFGKYIFRAFRFSGGKVMKRACKCKQCKCKHHKHKTLVKIIPGAFTSDLLY